MMKMPYWLLKLLPLFDYLCPRCRKEVPKNSHECPNCGEKYPLPLRVPPQILKDNKALEEYVHQHVFPRISEFERNYLTKYFTVLFSDGFESGDFNAWTGTVVDGGTLTAVTEDKHHGVYSAKAEKTPAAAYAQLYSRKTFAAQSTVFTRAYFKFTVPAYTEFLYHLGSTSWINVARLSASGAQWYWTLDYHSGATHLTVDSELFTMDTTKWYCIELKTVVHATAGEAKLYVDGVETLSVTEIDTDEHGNVVEMFAGIFWCGAAIANTLYYDCVVVADTGPIGPEVEVAAFKGWKSWWYDSQI